MTCLNSGDWSSRSSGNSQFSGQRNTSRLACQSRYRFIHSQRAGSKSPADTPGSRLRMTRSTNSCTAERASRIREVSTGGCVWTSARNGASRLSGLS